MFYVFYDSSGRITEVQENGISGERACLAMETLPDDIFQFMVSDGALTERIKTPEDIEQEKIILSREKKSLRINLLSRSDWTQSADSPLSDEQKNAWRIYRQELRDLPEHADWPYLDDADFPKSPA